MKLHIYLVYQSSQGSTEGCSGRKQGIWLPRYYRHLCHLYL